MKYGGFPGLLELKSEQSKKIYMEGLYNSVVVKDILNRRKNLDTNLLLRILRYMIDNIGNLSSANKIANYMSSNISKVSTRAVIDHIEALESAFIIYKVDRFKIVGKELLKTLNKHYIVDIGLRNMIEGYEIRDRGRMIENLVYNELIRRGYHVFVGVDNRFEVDFVASKDQNKIYYQVSLSIEDEKVRERELKGFNIIQDNYRKILITMDYGNSIVDGIEYKNLIDFLLEDI
jgi:predicted AAA+ superfamily ATPase